MVKLKKDEDFRVCKRGWKEAEEKGRRASSSLRWGDDGARPSPRRGLSSGSCPSWSLASPSMVGLTRPTKEVAWRKPSNSTYKIQSKNCTTHSTQAHIYIAQVRRQSQLFSSDPLPLIVCVSPGSLSLSVFCFVMIIDAGTQPRNT